MNIAILWHLADEFYNIRIPEGMKTASSSLMKMKHKVYNVDGVDWKYHIILTMNKKTLNSNKDGVDSSILRTYISKIRKVFPDSKYFWKYEEGRKSERPHFHLLFDLKEKLENKQKEIEKIMDVGDLSEFIIKQKKYDMNKKKSNTELMMGYFMFKLWNKGITHVRHIKNKIELLEQVNKDIGKRTGTEGFKKNKKRYGFSKGLKVKKVKKEKEYEWGGNCNPKEALAYLESTKDNFVKHFNKTYDGNIVYERTLEDLDEVRKKYEVKQKDLYDFDKTEQKDIDELYEGGVNE